MQIVSYGDNLHEMFKHSFLKKEKEKYFKVLSAGMFT